MSGGMAAGGSVVGDFLMRLAIALPLVCALAVLVLLVLRRWGGGRLAARLARPRPRPRLAVESVATLGPAARVALVRLDGRELLVGVSGGAIVLLADSRATGEPDGAAET